MRDLGTWRHHGEQIIGRVQVRDCNRTTDVDNNDPAIVILDGDYTAKVEGGETHVLDAAGNRIATFHAIHSVSRDGHGNLRLHRRASGHTTDGKVNIYDAGEHERAIKRMNEANEEFYGRNPIPL
jgi:hypothetical protein